MYRHPHAPASSFDYILDIFRNVSLRNKSMFILGDINDNLFEANSKLDRIVKNMKMKQLINKPTRITEMSSTLLDVIIVNNPEMVLMTDVFPCEIADHELISLKINISKPKRKAVYKTFRSLRNYNKNTFCNLLLEKTTELNSIINTDDVDAQVSTFNDIFQSCLNKCAPIITTQITRPPAPWITDEIRTAISHRNDIQRLLKCDRQNIHLQNKYKKEKKGVRSLIAVSKTKYFKEQLESSRGSSQRTWSIVKRLFPKSKGQNHHRFDSEIEKAEEFNSFFASVGETAFKKSRISFNPSLNDSSTSYAPANFRPQPVRIEDTILIVKDLRETKACGADGIQLRFVKDALPVIAFYLTILNNTSIVTGSYPSVWKHGHIVPAFKSGDINDVSNYRPISLLPIISKILEKIVTKQLMQYLESNALISNTQHGFRNRLSTETALLKVTDEIYKNMDNGKITLLSLCDLSKAFDSIHHGSLLMKMKNLYIDSFWFDNYLANRTQSVRIGNTVSNKLGVSYGVPQGSILGPILFMIFVNDMADMTENCIVLQYADDTQFILSGDVNNIDDLLHRAENSLALAKNYFTRNGLLINTGKTQCIFIGTRQNISRIPDGITIRVGEDIIVPSKQVKNLGLNFDCYMTFDTHINEICKKVIGTLLYINKIKHNFNKETRGVIVEALALSHSNYCCKIWGASSKHHLNRIQKLLNFAAKVVDGKARKYDHVSPILKELEWLNIEQKYFFEICVFIFKILHNILPSWLYALPTVSQMNTVTTRQRNDLFVPRFNTDLGSRAVNVRGPSVWNTLPSFIKDLDSLNVFKKRLKMYILNMA